MKRGINLLKGQKKYIDLDALIKQLKIAIAFIIIIFLVSYAFFYTILLSQRQKIDDLSLQKKAILEFLLKNKQVEAKFVYFRNKEKQLSDILKDDVNFVPYYTLLKDSLKSTTPEAKLQSVVVDKSKAVNFLVNLENYSSLISFLRFAESDEFLKNFNQLILSGFSSSSEIKNYQLGFRGSFVQLNEN